MTEGRVRVGLSKTQISKMFNFSTRLDLSLSNVSFQV